MGLFGRCLFPCVLIFLILQDALASLIEIPKNVAATVGDKVLLPCSSNLSVNISWHLYNFDGSRLGVFNGWRLSSEACPNCSLNHTLPNQWDIWFTAESEHGKVFECIEPWTAESAKASVSVLDSELRCSETAFGFAINLTCSVNFTGEWAPFLQWKELLGEESKFVTERASWISTIAAEHRACGTLYLSESDAQKSRTYQVILTFREKERPSHITVKNIPDYNRTWLYHYQPKEKEKEPEETTWTPGIVIIVVCTLFTLAASVTIIVYLVKKKPWKKESTLSATEMAHCNDRFNENESSEENPTPSALLIT